VTKFLCGLNLLMALMLAGCLSDSPSADACVTDDDCTTGERCLQRGCTSIDADNAQDSSPGTDGALRDQALDVGGPINSLDVGRVDAAASLDLGTRLDESLPTDTGAEPMPDVLVSGDVGAGPDSAADGSPHVPDARPLRRDRPCDHTPGGCPGLDFVPIAAGDYAMGGPGDPSRPIHQVQVPAFELLRSEVTVAQYRVCVDAGVCEAPVGRFFSNWMAVAGDREDHPVNYVTWFEARRFAEWVGARLPSEAEWEYAARNQGEGPALRYVWGEDEGECAWLAIATTRTMLQCGQEGTSSVCTHPLSNTAQGVCDMAGNVFEYVADRAHENYVGAPLDGSAWTDGPAPAEQVIVRGGAWNGVPPDTLVHRRWGWSSSRQDSHVGIRLARSVPPQ
jgi:formylglycine-generating enzyme required for sulfatase activity